MTSLFTKISIASFVAILAFMISLSYAATLTNITISFDEYAFPKSTTTVSGNLNYNVLDDTTGSKLSDAGNFGDKADLLMNFTSTSGALGTTSIEWQATSNGRFTMTQGYSGAVNVNNPGTLISNTITLTFAEHLTITDLQLKVHSLNTSGIAWEYSMIELFDVDGNSFSDRPVVSNYTSAVSLEGNISKGWFIAAGKATVTGVDTDTTSAGSNGTYDRTANSTALSYSSFGLSEGTEIGGFRITTYLEDVRGTKSSKTTSFTSSLTEFTISGTIIPEPGVVLFMLLGATMLFLPRRSRL